MAIGLTHLGTEMVRDTADTVSITTSADVAEGDGILAVAFWDVSTFGGVTDDAGNTYEGLTAGTGGTLAFVRRAQALASGSEITFQVTPLNPGVSTPRKYLIVYSASPGLGGSVGSFVIGEGGDRAYDPIDPRRMWLGGNPFTTGLADGLNGLWFGIIAWNYFWGDATADGTNNTTILQSNQVLDTGDDFDKIWTIAGESADPSGADQNMRLNTVPDNTGGFQGFLYFFTEIGDTSGKRIGMARGPDRRLLIAYPNNDGALFVNRYDDAEPPTVAQTVTIESAETLGGCLQYLRSAIPVLLYPKNSDILLRTSRDQGRTWSVASTIISGYQDVCHVVDEARGLLVAMVWKEADEAWSCVVGTLDSGGTTWSFGSAVSVVTNALRGGDLIRRADGTYEFTYRTTADVLTVIRNRSLSKAGAGSWA